MIGPISGLPTYHQCFGDIFGQQRFRNDFLEILNVFSSVMVFWHPSTDVPSHILQSPSIENQIPKKLLKCRFDAFDHDQLTKSNTKGMDYPFYDIKTKDNFPLIWNLIYEIKSSIIMRSEGRAQILPETSATYWPTTGSHGALTHVLFGRG